MDTELFDNCNPHFDDLEPEKKFSKNMKLVKVISKTYAVFNMYVYEKLPHFWE